MRLTRKQWLREIAEEAYEEAAAFDEVQQLPTFVPMRCRSCGHRGSAQLPFNRKHRVRLVCCRPSKWEMNETAKPWSR